MTEPTPNVPQEAATLPSGDRMPLLGLGTWQVKGDVVTESVAVGLEVGYRHLDTATAYGNESQVGRALQDSGLPRERVFVVTKLPPDREGRELATLRTSLDELGTENVDLWLLHWPAREARATERLWRAMVEAHRAGLARDIGVSNFTVAQIDALTQATRVAPAVNQVAWNPLRYDPVYADALRQRGVVLEAYSPLRGGVLDDSTVTGIAAQVGRTPAQVVIRWHIQHGFVVIPKSVHPDRIRSNAEVGDFALSGTDMAALDALGGGAWAPPGWVAGA